MMKFTLSTLLLAFAVTAGAQKIKNDAVPAAVSEAFKKEFPSAKASWEKEKDGNYEAEFKYDGKEASATFEPSGHRKEIELEIETGELPKAALDYLEQRYPDEKIKEAARITDDKKIVTYEAEITKDGKSTDVLFDVNGKFIK